MFNRGEYILFSMRARIVDQIYDPVYGDSYIVECENHGGSVIRVPADNVDMRFVPTVQRKFPGQRSMPMPMPTPRHHRRRSSNGVFLDGVPQSGFIQDEWTERDVMSRPGTPVREQKG